VTQSGSLRRRLLTGAGAFILAAIALSAIGLGALFEQHVKRWIDIEIEAHIDQVIAGLNRDSSGRLVVTPEPDHPRFQEPLSGLYWEVAVDQGPTIRSRSLWDYVLKLPAAAVDGEAHHYRVEGPGHQLLYLMQRHIELPARLGGAQARVAVALNEAEVKAAVWQFAKALAPYLAVLAALLITAAWVQVSFGLKPLGEVKDRIAAVRTGTQSRLGDSFPEEVQPLAREIDTLLDARDEQIARARMRAADLAHGLKTPLQVLSGHISRLQDRGLRDVASDLEIATRSMQRHVDRHLARARLAAGQKSASTSVDDAVDQLMSVVRRTPAGEKLNFTTDIPADLRAAIDKDDLTEALGNLLENACRYARTDVTITATRDGDAVIVAVLDNGPGIAEEDAASALSRGTRLDAKGAGAGLGLAIVSDIAEAWSGRVNFVRPAGWFGVTLMLPIADAR